MKVFLSYSHVDDEVAHSIESILDSKGIPYFRDEKNIEAGEEIKNEILTGLKGADVLLVISSPASLKSHWVNYEVGVAEILGLTIVTYLTHPALELPSFLRERKTINSLDDLRRFFERKGVGSISVSRMTEGNYDDARGIVALYTNLFQNDGTNYSPEVLLEFLTSPVLTDRHYGVLENVILVAKNGEVVTGFIFCHYYNQQRRAMISYYAIDKSDESTRSGAAKALTAKLRDILSAQQRDCEYLFFDTLCPDPGSTSDEETRERRARPALFKLTALSLGLRAFQFHFDYRAPRLSLEPTAREHRSTLLCIPLSGRSFPVGVSKALVLDFLRFIYIDCHGDCYRPEDPRFGEYQRYLLRLVASYTESLPEQIPTD